MHHPFEVCAFYRFVTLADHAALQAPIRARCGELGVKGTILLAPEGINATISATPEAMAAFFDYLERDSRFARMERKVHRAPSQPFGRMKVRLKREIVTLGVEGLNPATGAGEYIPPAGWDAVLADPETIVIDTRNAYEVAMGTFRGAVNPETASFRSFPGWVRQNLDPARHRKVAMFCTGGIRCEKSTALLRQMGFESVMHLQGGILQYLADTGNESGAWLGECFVFDGRVAVDATLSAVTREEPDQP